MKALYNMFSLCVFMAVMLFTLGPTMAVTVTGDNDTIWANSEATEDTTADNKTDWATTIVNATSDANITSWPNP